MTETLAYIALAAASAALIALALVALRLRRARREFKQEVTAWKSRLELDLTKARKDRNQLLDALDEGFLLIDSDATILFANRSASRLFRGQNLIGLSTSEVFLDRRMAGSVMESIETGESTKVRVSLSQQSSPLGNLEQRGVNSWVIDAARVSGSPEEKPTTRVVIRDVTSEHQTEQIRKDFVANASHELRTPLAIINGYLENLIDDGLLEDQAITRRFLKVMRKHTERIARIVEDMLVISRLESGEAAALKVEPFKFRSCIQDVLERLELVIQGQQATIDIIMPDEELTLQGDRFYWTQVLFNLVENALKQNPRKGLKVTIGCVREDGVTRIWVADDGIGIPSADLAHIFRRFYRVEKHHSQDEVKGTGLGLSIVKRAIEAHGGSISVSSTPGNDTRFSIEIPVEAERSLARKEAEARED